MYTSHHNTLCLSPKTEDNANAKLWGDKQRILWYFLEW